MVILLHGIVKFQAVRQPLPGPVNTPSGGQARNYMYHSVAFRKNPVIKYQIDSLTSLHTLMVKQLLSILALLIFVNSASYIPGKVKCAGDVNTNMLIAKSNACHVYGRTLLSVIMKNVFDLPIGAPKHKKTFFKYFLCLAMAYTACISVNTVIAYIKKLLRSYNLKLSPLFRSKFHIVPGYYSYLFRLSPF